RFAPDKILYVVAAQQSLHFQQIIAVFRRINHPVAEKIKHIAYGFVPGVSTRKGGSEKISLALLLDEAHERALEAYRSQVAKRPEAVNEEEIAELVGQGAVTFEFLSRSSMKD